MKGRLNMVVMNCTTYLDRINCISGGLGYFPTPHSSRGVMSLDLEISSPKVP